MDNIHDVINKGCRYIITTFVDGMTLNRYVEEKNPSLEEAIQLLLQVTTIIKKIHQENIVHRDIKYDNILVDNDQTIHIIDFGTAYVPNDTSLDKYELEILDPKNDEADLTELTTEIKNQMIVIPELIGRRPKDQKEPLSDEDKELTRKRRHFSIDTTQCCALLIYLTTKFNYGYLSKQAHRKNSECKKALEGIVNMANNQTERSDLFLYLMHTLDNGLHTDFDYRYSSLDALMNRLIQMQGMIRKEYIDPKLSDIKAVLSTLQRRSSAVQKSKRKDCFRIIQLLIKRDKQKFVEKSHDWQWPEDSSVRWSSELSYQSAGIMVYETNLISKTDTTIQCPVFFYAV